MLLNLLPGLRELRAPLVSGYLWLISAWLFLGRMNWLPTERPPGNGEVARLWDLGGTLGKTVVLAVVTFIAYLIGSFLEMDPDGLLAARLKPLLLRGRRPWYGNEKVKEQPYYESVVSSLSSSEPFYSEGRANTVAQSISPEARRSLIDALEQRDMLPERIGPLEPEPTFPGIEEFFDQERRKAFETAQKERERKFVEQAKKELKNDMAADMAIYEIVQEMPQLASRLLVKNQNLYGKHDRQMAEASVRMNISIPLTALLMALWLSSLPIWLRLALTVVAAGFGYMLLRQGFLRAMSARDVIVQALVIGQVESRYMPSEVSTEKPAAKTPKDRKPVPAIQEPASTQGPRAADPA